MLSVEPLKLFSSLLTLITACCWVSISHAQDDKIYFDLIGNTGGVERSSIQEIYEDSYGYLWVGNYAGLHRFDGYEIVSYTNDKRDSLSIGDNKISAIHEDVDANLWIGTQNGLYRYDRDLETFKNVLLKSTRNNNPYILDIQQDNKGRIWVTSHNGVHCLKTNNTQLEFSTTFTGEHVFDCLEDNLGNIWVVSTKKIFKYVESENNFHEFILPLSFSNNPQESFINCVQSHVDNSLYLSSTNKTYRFSMAKEVFFVPPNIESGLVALASLPNGMEILLDNRNGVHYKYDLNNSLLTKLDISNFPEIEKGDSFNFMETSNHLIVFNRNGMHKVNSKNRFKSISWPEDLSVNHSYFYNVYEVQKKRILVNTSQGPVLFDLKTKEIQNISYPNDINEADWRRTEIHFLLDNGVDSSIIGTNNGLFHYKKSMNEIVSFDETIQGLDMLKGKSITALCFDKDKNLWVGTWNAGIYKVAIKDKYVKRYLKSNTGNALKRMARSMILDRDNIFWVGTRGGLGKYNSEQDTFYFYTASSEDSNSLSENTVFDIHEDKDGFFWIGTYGGGLDHFDKNKGVVTESYTTSKGLIDNNVMVISPDGKRNLWLKTFEGISKFDLEKKEIESFGHEDGLLSNSQTVFNSGISPYTGEIYMKNVEGLQFFHPDSIFKSTFKPNVVFTDFKLSNKSVGINKSKYSTSADTFLLDKSINSCSKVTLNHNQNVITFNYAVLNLSNSSKVVYKYKLEGFDKDWQNIGNTRSVTFTNLDPGNYTLKVKGTNIDGVWSSKTKSIDLEILPPWYQTWWAKLLYALFLGIVALAIYRYQKRRLELQAQLNFEKKEADRLLELDTLKTNLYTNITHEFRTPLTVILGLANLIKEQIPGISEKK